MVYAYDQWAQLPVKDLYDSLLMLASVNAARDMYEKGLLEVKDFKKEYGDFLSPIQKDMDWYSKNVTGKVQNVVNQLYAAGIDPLRSAEGRLLISRTINNIDTARMARNRVSAANAEEYLKNKAKLQAAGLWNEDYEDFALNGKTLDNFSSENDVWTNVSPHQYTNLQELVHPSFAAIKPHMLSQAEVESRGYEYDPMNDYTGIVRSDMERAMGSLMPGVRDDVRFLYHRELARRDLVREGNYNPTDAQIDEKLVNNAITADSQVMTPLEVTPNKFALMEAEARKLMRVHAANAALDHQYRMMERANTPGYDSNGNPISVTSDEGVSLKEHGYTTALANTLGEGYDRSNMDFAQAGKDINRVQKEFGKQVGNNAKMFEKRFTTSDAIHVEDVKAIHGGNTTNLGFLANFEDISRLKSYDDVITGTRGYRGRSTNTSTDLRTIVQNAMNEGNFVEIIPHGGTYGAQTKDNYYSINAPVTIRVYDNTEGKEKDDNGNKSYKDIKGYWNMGWDSMSAPTTWDDRFVDTYDAMHNMAELTPAMRTMKRGFERTALFNNFDLEDPANVYPYDRDASSDTQSTHKRLNASPSAKLATMYK